jgi:hypothetical protein
MRFLRIQMIQKLTAGQMLEIACWEPTCQNRVAEWLLTAAWALGFAILHYTRLTMHAWCS